MITGATGLVGSHVAERAHQFGLRTRTIVRASSDTSLLKQWGVEQIVGDLTNPEVLRQAASGATLVVHCAAKVGDWGPVEDYRDVNVRALDQLLQELESQNTLRHFVDISSLGVYEGRDHYGTDESEQPSSVGIDGYTLTKFEAEQLVLQHVRDKKLPATVLRPGFIYGPRDRTVLPKLLMRLKQGKVKFLGSGEQKMNNTYVENLVDAIFLALESDSAIGEVYNITDGRLVSKREFIGTAAQQAGYGIPTKSVPLPVAKSLARVMESTWKLLGKKEAPLLSNARIKFLGLNLDFCIDKARRQLGYDPQVDFTEGMRRTVEWFRSQNML